MYISPQVKDKLSKKWDSFALFTHYILKNSKQAFAENKKQTIKYFLGGGLRATKVMKRWSLGRE